jgi:hypothetical protein
VEACRTAASHRARQCAVSSGGRQRRRLPGRVRARHRIGMAVAARERDVPKIHRERGGAVCLSAIGQQRWLDPNQRKPQPSYYRGSLSRHIGSALRGAQLRQGGLPTPPMQIQCNGESRRGPHPWRLLRSATLLRQRRHKFRLGFFGTNVHFATCPEGSGSARQV